jgi:hypothetical protein
MFAGNRDITQRFVAANEPFSKCIGETECLEENKKTLSALPTI